MFQPSFKINSEVLADDSSQYERYAVFIYMRYVAETFGIDFTSYQARKDLKDTFTFMIKLAKVTSKLPMILKINHFMVLRNNPKKIKIVLRNDGLGNLKLILLKKFLGLSYNSQNNILNIPGKSSEIVLEF